MTKYESNHHRTHRNPSDGLVAGKRQRSRGWGHIDDGLKWENLISEAHSQAKSSHHRRSHSISPARASRTSYHRGDPAPRKPSKSEHAMGKAIRTGSEAAFQIRNDRGSWFGEKGIKVASVAIVSATIDFLLGVDRKKHPLAHVAVSIVEGVIVDRITNGKRKGGIIY